MLSQKKIAFIFIFLIINLLGFSQEKTQTPKKIEIIHSNDLEVNEKMGKNVQILRGNVSLKHEDATMFCDSAFFNTAENSFTAMSNVHIVKPSAETDTVHLFGDSLNYVGKEKMAIVRKNVRLTKDSMILTTENLNFDLKTEIGYYFDKGTTINDQDTLKSEFGYFYSRTDELFFKKDVIILSQNYKIYSDTLRHHTKHKISYFFGPTYIVSKENLIYCENGWYNHKNEKCQFQKNAYLQSKHQKLSGDSLFYDRKERIGRAFRNVELLDTVQNIVLKGNVGFYKEKPEESILYNEALFMQISESDTLFLHADTLRSNYDSAGNYRILKAFYKCQLFKKDMQACCDSLVYSFKDSTTEMHRNPVIWNEENQLTADFIKIFSRENKVYRIEMKNAAFIVSQEDSLRFNQVKGRNMIGYLKNNRLYKVDVDANAETVYFAKDGETIIGVNKISSSTMKIYLGNNKIDKIWFYTKPSSTLYPPNQLSPQETLLPDFKWLDKLRPKNKYEIMKKEH